MTPMGAYTLAIDGETDQATMNFSYMEPDDPSEDVTFSFPLDFGELLGLAWDAVKTAFWLKVPWARPR